MQPKDLIPWGVGLTLTIIAPILYDFYRSTSAIELQVISDLELLGPARTINRQKLNITYEGRPVTNISQMTFALINTGRVPIKKADVSDPPTLIFPAKVLDVQKERVEPPNLKVDLKMEPTTNKVSIAFDMFNQENLIQFSVLLDGKPEYKEAYAQIAGVKKLEINDRRKELKPEGSKEVPWTVYPVGLFTAITALITIAGVPQAIGFLRIKRRIHRYIETHPPKDLADFQESLDFIASNVQSLPPGPFRESLTQLVHGLDRSNLSAASFSGFLQTLNDNLRRQTGGQASALISFLIIVGLGTWYLLKRLSS